jgi:hypothetical protein
VWAVEQGAAGDVDEPGAWAHGPKHGVVDEGRLAGLITGRDDDRAGVGDAVEEAAGGVEGRKGRDGAIRGMPAHAGDGHVEGSEPAGDLGADSPGADDTGRRAGE